MVKTCYYFLFAFLNFLNCQQRKNRYFSLSKYEIRLYCISTSLEKLCAGCQRRDKIRSRGSHTGPVAIVAQDSCMEWWRKAFWRGDIRGLLRRRRGRGRKMAPMVPTSLVWAEPSELELTLNARSRGWGFVLRTLGNHEAS